MNSSWENFQYTRVNANYESEMLIIIKNTQKRDKKHRGERKSWYFFK